MSADMVNHPPHYKREGGVECIEAIRSALTPDEYRGYLKGNCIKYVWRERFRKGLQDVHKLGWYGAELARFLETNNDDIDLGLE